MKFHKRLSIPIALDIILVVLGDDGDSGKTIQNRFRSELNNFVQYEDTFLDTAITKFQTVNGLKVEIISN
jgi:hypothetical protein